MPQYDSDDDRTKGDGNAQYLKYPIHDWPRGILRTLDSEVIVCFSEEIGVSFRIFRRRMCAVAVYNAEG